MTEDNIQLPNYLCFKPSKAKIGHNGLFATRTLKPNEPLGIYRGKIRRILPQTADEEYVCASVNSTSGQSRSNTSLKRSASQTQHAIKSSSSVRHSWKQTDDIDQSTECSKPSSTSTNRSHIPDALQDYDHVCAKCNMPFNSQSSLDEHQNGQCLEMNVLASCGSWFRCPLCSLTYCDANLMSLHINKTHRDVLKSNQRGNSQRRSNNNNRNSQTLTTSRSEHHHLRKYS
ncbi:unnamed protein product [Rotaria sordida]|uniref:C2H2-type domain-containing protein n=1 Tax=Rotaria sordida TaxID=392033 RepID=A0A814NA98_9BILA|nr:unnamed protein product [Rotaria sordida]